MPTTATTVVRRASGVVALLLTSTYLIWRLGTFNTDALWMSVPFYLLELAGLISLALFLYSVWDTDAVQPPEPVSDTHRSIAVLVPTYNEDPEILLPTVAAAVDADLTHETWVLDDGRRPWVEDMAKRLGANYLTRPDNNHAKAGNLNHALEHLDVELVAVLDADHVPEKRFLANTVAYFDDPELALVQTPQAFYNDDSFEHVGDHYQEESLFYRVIQPGKNRWNAAFWCGTSAVVRTAALRSVGGVATESLTEDLHTTLRLHREGWKTVFHNEVLARGLAPQNYNEYGLQRKRWAAGAMQVLRSDNPFRGRSLTVRQKLAYAATLSGWTEGWRTVTYLLIAVAVLFTGVSPLVAPIGTFALFYGVVFVAQQLAMRSLSQGYHRILPGLLFDWYRVPASIRAFQQLTFPKAVRFKVTPKGRSGSERLLPDLPRSLVGLVLLAFTAWVWFLLSTLGVTPVSYADRATSVVALVFLAGNVGLIVFALARGSSVRFGTERRAARRFRRTTVSASVGGWQTDLLVPSLTGAVLTGAVVDLAYVGSELTVGIGPRGRQRFLTGEVRRRTSAGVTVEFEPQQWEGMAAISGELFNAPMAPVAAAA